MTIGERIKQLRKMKKISQADLARNINVSSGNVGDWERGKAKPGADALILLMQYFSVSADWILTGNCNFKSNIVASKDTDLDISTLADDEKMLILSFRNFDELDKELIMNIVYILIKKLEKNSALNSFNYIDNSRIAEKNKKYTTKTES